MDRGATRVSLMAGTGVRGMGAAPGASGSVGDPVELCAQVHIVVSGLDVQHNTQTVVTLLRALLIQLHSFARSSSSGHLTALMMHTHVKLGVVILQNTEDTQLAIWHFSQCMQLGKSINIGTSAAAVGGGTGSEVATQDPTAIENYLLAAWNIHIINSQQLKKEDVAVDVLYECLSAAKANPRWFFRMCLQIVKLVMSLNERGTQRGPGVANMSKWGANKAGDPSSSSSSSAVAEDAPENSGCASVDKCMEMLCMAESYALERVRTQYMSHLMRLTRIFLLLRKGEVMQAYSLCDSSEHSLMQFASATNNEFHANHIKVHFLVLKMIALISRGKIKTSRPCLKQLQDAIKLFTQANLEGMRSKNPAEQFQWMSTGHVCILAYLITVIHHSSGGTLEKAKKYSEKALSQIEILRNSSAPQAQGGVGTGEEGSVSGGNKDSESNQLLLKLHIMIIQSAVQCDLVIGKKQLAIKKIAEILSIGSEIKDFSVRYAPQIHMLLGLYSMTMNIMDNAEAQFQSVLTTSANKDLVIFAALNLSVIFLRAGNRQQETSSILAKVDPQSFPSSSDALKAAANFLRSLQAFYNGQYHEATRFIRETLKISTEEDITRLITCSLVLLSHVYLMSSSGKECCETVSPALKMADKVPDSHVKLWAAALLADACKLPPGPGNPSSSASKYQQQNPEAVHANVKQQLLHDFMTSSKLEQHRLIQWVEGPLPDSFLSLVKQHQQQQL